MQAALVAAAQQPGFVAAASGINGIDNFFLSSRANRLTAFAPGIDNFLDDGALAAYQGNSTTLILVQVLALTSFI